MTGRLRLHVALAAGFVPGLAFLLSLGLAAGCRRDDRPWFARLWLLVATDLAVVLCLLSLKLPSETLSAEPPKRRLGVALEEGSLRVRSVLPGSPAERAGFQAGDVILSVDGTAVEDLPRLQEALNRGGAGAAVRVAVGRGDETLEFDVTPEEFAAREIGLFEAVPDRSFRLEAGLALPYVPLLLLILILRGIAARGRGPKVRVWTPVVSILVLSFAAGVGAALLLNRSLGGWSLGAVILMLAAQTAVMLGAGLLVRPRLSPVPEPAAPSLSAIKAFLLGLFYLATGAFRIAIVALALNHWVFGGDATGSDVIHTLVRTRFGLGGKALLVAAVVIVGPIAEELVFRGILLPRLAASLGTAAGLWGSALAFGLIHPHYEFGVLVVAWYGAVLGWARLRTGGLAAPIALHVAINGIVTLLALFLRD